MENPYLKKLKKDGDFEFIDRIVAIIPEVFEVLKLMLEIETEEKLTPVKFKAARILEEHGMLNGKEFTKEIGLAQSTSSELLSRMIGDGTVIKVHDKKDGRSSVFLLSEEGEALYYRVEALRYKRLKVILGYLSDKEQKQFVNALEGLALVLKKFEE